MNYDTYIAYIRQVLQALREGKLPIDIFKSKFFQREIKYLGLIIGLGYIRIDLAKVEAILGQEVPKNARNVLVFLGIANFYRRFIEGFSTIALLMTLLIKGFGSKDRSKRAAQNWTAACQASFDILRTAFTTAPVLQHYDPEKLYTVYPDALDRVVGRVLSQLDKKGVLYLVAFFLSKLNPAECNYEIYDKELIAIVRCFEEQRPELIGIAEPIQVFSNYRTLQYFLTTKILNRRQARQSEFLLSFYFKLDQIKGTDNVVADALIRRLQDQDGKADNIAYY